MDQKLLKRRRRRRKIKYQGYKYGDLICICIFSSLCYFYPSFLPLPLNRGIFPSSSFIRYGSMAILICLAEDLLPTSQPASGVCHLLEFPICIPKIDSESCKHTNKRAKKLFPPQYPGFCCYPNNQAFNKT